MNSLVLLLSAVSLATMLLGLFAWRLTSSKPLIVNTLFASAAFLICAYGVSVRQPGPFTVAVPFLVTMLLAGRTLAMYWRGFHKHEQDLLVPGHLMAAATLMGLIGTSASFVSQTPI
jgi:hypothetical protein